MSEICSGDSLWQWSCLEISRKRLWRSTILHKGFIIIIIFIIVMIITECQLRLRILNSPYFHILANYEDSLDMCVGEGDKTWHVCRRGRTNLWLNYQISRKEMFTFMQQVWDNLSDGNIIPSFNESKSCKILLGLLMQLLKIS